MKQFFQKYFPSIAPIFVLIASITCMLLSIGALLFGLLNGMTIEGPLQRAHLASAIVYGAIALVASLLATLGFVRKNLIWLIVITGTLIIFSGVLVYDDWKALQACAPQEFFCN